MKMSVLQVSMHHDLIAFMTIDARLHSAHRMLFMGHTHFASVLLVADIITDGLSTASMD